jgi:hypothetical protein
MSTDTYEYEWQVSTITGLEKNNISLRWFPGKSRFVLVIDQPTDYVRIELTEKECKDLTETLNSLWKKTK